MINALFFIALSSMNHDYSFIVGGMRKEDRIAVQNNTRTKFGKEMAQYLEMYWAVNQDDELFLEIVRTMNGLTK
jgi:hypothetical protein